MKLKFDSNQRHQIDAIESTLRLFDKLPSYEQDFQMGDEIVPNIPSHYVLDESWILSNLVEIQSINGLNNNPFLDLDEGLMEEGLSIDSWRYPQFTVEMETGTGKTYIYLRTIYELKKKHGFKKFIVIVPSVAIYEGVVKSIEITKEHFQTLYGNENIHLTQYQGQHISKLRGFATSSFTELMVMTLDSFNKTSNVIFKATEKLPGEMLPYQYIQETRPILILDESQNYRSEKARAALRTLKPLFSINYSATPIDKFNLIYRLTPVDAFKQNLVKRIEVLGVTEQYNTNVDQLSFQINEPRVGYGLSIEATLNVLREGSLKQEVVNLRKNDNLFEKTGNVHYMDLIIDEINRRDGVVIFTNGHQISVNDSSDVTLSKEEIFRVQLEETIKYHFEKQKELLPIGIKVLSLIFIDRVSNYMNEDGIIKKLFDDAFNRSKKNYLFYKDLNPEEVREGYFAKKVSKNKPDEFIDTHIENEQKTQAEKELEKAAYELIMKDKEKLLSFEDKHCFIFAHSALKEGWDNPNVFQICTLNQTKSETKKRQEIGRGLRLAVNQDGERVFEDDVNILTVIANESYENYVNNLQVEYQESGDASPPPPSNAIRRNANRNSKIFNSEEFNKFWKNLTQKTEYTINIDTNALIEACINKLDVTQFPEPQIVISKGQFVMTEFVISLLEVKAKLCKIRVEISDTIGNSSRNEQWYKDGDDISRRLNDKRLKGFKVVDIKGTGDDAEVVFGDKGELIIGNQIKFQSERGQELDEHTVHEAQTIYPVFNLIQRTANETKLTRPTILNIFKGLSERTKSYIFKNPEGYATIFIKTIKELLANHIAENIEYVIKYEFESYEIEAIFPPTKKFPQKELLEGTDWSLYDFVQIDSDIEKRFVTNRLNEDKNIICYFKFPSKFKISMPKIIGNYNPDWGIIRYDENKKIKLELVRETKGNIDPNLLQYPNEKRKIDCAKKHFTTIKMDYRQVTDEIPNWFEKGS